MSLEPATFGQVVLESTRGPIILELFSREAPSLEGYFDDCKFHRIVPDFIVQTGDPTGTGFGGESVWVEPFQDEFHSRLRFNRRGLVGMANNGANDNRSQFFITLAATPELQNKNTLFARVPVESIYNVLNLAQVERDSDDRPIQPDYIVSTKVVINPFDDIIPREKAIKVKAVQPRKKAPQVSGRNLLSFHQASSDEDDNIAPSITIKRGAEIKNRPTKISTSVAPIEGNTEFKKTAETQISKQSTSDMVAQKIAQLKQSRAMMHEPKPMAKPSTSALEKIRQEFFSSSQDAIMGYQKKLKRNRDLYENQTLKKLWLFEKKVHETRLNDSNTVLTMCSLHKIKDCRSCLPAVLIDQDTSTDEWMTHKLEFVPDTETRRQEVAASSLEVLNFKSG